MRPSSSSISRYLPAPVDAHDPAPGHPLDEPVRLLGAHQLGVVHLDPGERAPRDPLGQLRADGLDLGQLRHRPGPPRQDDRAVVRVPRADAEGGREHVPGPLAGPLVAGVDHGHRLAGRHRGRRGAPAARLPPPGRSTGRRAGGPTPSQRATSPTAPRGDLLHPALGGRLDVDPNRGARQRVRARSRRPDRRSWASIQRSALASASPWRRAAAARSRPSPSGTTAAASARSPATTSASSRRSSGPSPRSTAPASPTSSALPTQRPRGRAPCR